MPWEIYFTDAENVVHPGIIKPQASGRPGSMTKVSTTSKTTDQGQCANVIVAPYETNDKGWDGLPASISSDP